MKKIITNLILIITILVFSSIVYAELCTERSVTGCTMTTPNISCTDNYLVYNVDGTLEDNSSMSLISEGLYKFDLNLNQGSYSVLLCSGHQTDIEIISSGERTATQSNLTTVQFNVNNTDVAESVWDYNLSEHYSAANDDNYVANLAGEKVLQSLRFLIQVVFGW